MSAATPAAAAIDLNADIGEGCGDDALLLAIVTSCNIACGGHTGDDATMASALSAAKALGVAAGAHPSYPDTEHFGRRRIYIDEADLRRSLETQISRLRTIAFALGVELVHVKPHGALYNDAATDGALARLVAAAIEAAAPGAAIVGPPGSMLSAAADAGGLRFFAEGFADRAYEADGSLRDRRLQGAVLGDERARIDQALSIALRRELVAHGGELVPLAARTICIHGDTEGAVASARAIRAALSAAGVEIRAP